MIRRLKWGNYLKSLTNVRNKISSLEVGHNNVIDTDRSSFHPKDTKDREKYSPGSWRRPRKVLFVCLFYHSICWYHAIKHFNIIASFLSSYYTNLQNWGSLQRKRERRRPFSMQYSDTKVERRKLPLVPYSLQNKASNRHRKYWIQCHIISTFVNIRLSIIKLLFIEQEFKL